MASSHVSQRVRRSAVSPTPTRTQPLRATVPYQLRAGLASPSGQGLPAVGKAATTTTANATATAPSSSPGVAAAAAAAATPVPSPCAQPVAPCTSLPCAPAAQNYGKRSAAAAVVTTSTSTSTGSATSSTCGGSDGRASELSPFSAVGLDERSSSSSVRLAVPSADHQPHQQQQQHNHHHQQQRVSPERSSPGSPVPKVQRSRTFHVTAPAGAGWQGGPPGALTGPYLSGQWPREPPVPHHGLNSTCDKATQTPCTWTDRAPERRSSLHRRSASWGSADPRREASWPRRDSIPVSSVPLGRWGLAWLRGSLEGLNQELEGVFLHNEDTDRARRQLQNAPDGHRAPLPCPPGRSSATRTVDTQTPPVPARRDARTPGSPERGGPRDRAATVHGGSGGATRPADAAAAPAASPSRRADDGGVAGAEAAAKRRSAAAVAALGSAEGPESPPCLARPAPLQPDGRSPFVCVCVEAEAVPTPLPSSGGPGASDGPHGAVAASGAAVAVAAVDGAFFLPKLISAPRAGRSSTFPKPVRAARGPEDRPAPEGREGSPVGSCNLEELSTQFGGTVTISSPDKNKVNFIPNSNSAFISIRSIRCASLSCLEGTSEADWGPPSSCRTLVMDRDTLLTKPAHISRGQAAPGLAGGWPESRNSGAACPSANRTGTPPESREPQTAAAPGGAGAAAAARPPDLTASPKPSSQGPPSGVVGLLGPPQNDGERGRPQAGAAMPPQTHPVLC
uniref:Segmentation polarity homeobox protein engrailed-like isoform X3 n=1 Tax=Petromyzon marinus TaxID=7757 RepID=A0AAJ7SXZ4_PETMA|nr:segmentation polarity homeobox protein engrailed-like isoform X3 [Petromyzon marinus]